MITDTPWDPKLLQDQSMTSREVKPSPKYIERIFTEENFDFTRYDDTDLEFPLYLYAWQSVPDESYSPHRRRFWHAKRKTV